MEEQWRMGNGSWVLDGGLEGRREAGEKVNERERERECPSISLALNLLTHGEAAKHSLVTPVSVGFLLWS